MSPTIWLLVTFLAVDALEQPGKEILPKSDILLGNPKIVDSFKNLVYKALNAEGSNYRYLLITAGLVPAPLGYKSLLENGQAGKLQDIPLSLEMREHFEKHITDLFSSPEKLEYAMKRLLVEQLFKNSKDSDFKLAEHFKSIEDSPETICNIEAKDPNAACKDSLSMIPELPKLPEVDFVMTTQPGFDTVAESSSESIVDKIASESIEVFSDEQDSPTQQSNLHEVPLSNEGDEVGSFTPLDDDFIMHVMSSSLSSILSKFDSSSDDSTVSSENKIEPSTEFLSMDDSVTESETETSEMESDSMYIRQLSPKPKVLTFDEIQLLEQSLRLQPELKYHVIGTFMSEDSNPLSDVDYSSGDVTDSTSSEASGSKFLPKKRRRISPRGIFLEEPVFYLAPVPHTLILRHYQDIPETSFTCENRPVPGFYADQETDCQVFHVCWPGRRESFLCPVGSLFNQEAFSCDNFNNSNCKLANAFFSRNEAFQDYDDKQARNVTPKPDPLLKPIQNDSGTAVDVNKVAYIAELFEADLHFAGMLDNYNMKELWPYLPVKAKVFIYPEPADVKAYIAQHRHHHHHKIRKSKDVRGLEDGIGSGDFEDSDAVDPDILRKRQRIEANIIRVLKMFSKKYRN